MIILDLDRYYVDSDEDVKHAANKFTTSTPIKPAASKTNKSVDNDRSINDTWASDLKSFADDSEIKRRLSVSNQAIKYTSTTKREKLMMLQKEFTNIEHEFKEKVIDDLAQMYYKYVIVYN